MDAICARVIITDLRAQKWLVSVAAVGTFGRILAISVHAIKELDRSKLVQKRFALSRGILKRKRNQNKNKTFLTKTILFLIFDGDNLLL